MYEIKFTTSKSWKIISYFSIMIIGSCIESTIGSEHITNWIQNNSLKIILFKCDKIGAPTFTGTNKGISLVID